MKILYDLKTDSLVLLPDTQEEENMIDNTISILADIGLKTEIGSFNNEDNSMYIKLERA